MVFNLFKTAVPRSILVVLVFLSCSLPMELRAESRARNILFVFSWNQDLPWQKEVEKGFEQQFNVTGERPNLYFEYMDAGRFNGPSQHAIFRNYLEKKYARTRLDNVVLESAPAARLIQSHPGMFGKARLIALNPSLSGSKSRDLAASVPVQIDFIKSVRNVLKISKAKTVYLVGGTTPATRERERVITGLLSRMNPGPKVVSLVGLPMEKILSRVEKTGPDSIILYLLVFRDGSGKTYVPFHASQLICARANAPVYSFWTSLLGSGIVGGYLLSGERVGREAAMLLTSGVRKGFQDDLSDRFHGYYWDWRQLLRWDISESSLPADSNILFKRPEFFHEHSTELVIAIILFVLTILYVRYRELKRYNRQIEAARKGLQSVNMELGRVKSKLEEKNEMLRKVSVTDRLTGLHNRAYLEDRLRDELRRIGRHPADLCVILADIDHFKRVNDLYGHPVGDEVLVKISETLRENVRSIDDVGRWGGEEFMIICPGANEQEGVHLAEKLRAIIGEQVHDTAGKITSSFGVASYVPGLSEVNLIKNADEALYNSKSSGRNCVSSITPEKTVTPD